MTENETNIYVPDPKDSLEFVGGLNDTLRWETEEVYQTLLSTSLKLSHGGQFTGRPCTGLFYSKGVLVKVRNEYHLPADTARRMAQKYLEKERLLGIHHPTKAWYLIHRPGLDTVWIANATKLLKPVHQHTKPTDLARDMARAVDIILQVAAQHQIRIDEGLSNYGLDESGTLYYLDDDLYKWRNHSTFVQALAHWCRAYTWLPAESFRELGEIINVAIKQHFKDTHNTVVVREQLKSEEMFNESQEQNRNILVQGLDSTPGDKQPAKVAVPCKQVEPVTGKRIALLGDIHANYSALNCVMRALEEENIDTGIILGDIVGYGPSPAECIDLIRNSNLSAIRGNHDHMVGTGYVPKYTNDYVLASCNWTKEKLSQEDKDWLAELPEFLELGNGILAVHGAPCDRTFFYAYVYDMTYENNLQEMENRDLKICFHGHTHIQKVYYDDGQNQGSTTDEIIDLKQYPRSLVNPGSVGKPRNRCTKSQFGIFDMQTWQLEFRSIEYDVDQVVNDIYQTELPSIFADRLATGT